ncbi:MAG: tetratricopeptide repeat protein [Ideonella sp.]|nr:tetratricopeptide repeat protein [Ideonella sp.]
MQLRLLLPRPRVALLALSATLCVLTGTTATAAPVSTRAGPEAAASTLLDLTAPADTTPDLVGLGTASGLSALKAISRGRWPNGCNIATTVLARKVADVDALGVFTMCAAIRNDVAVVGTALKRLHEAETAPYFSALSQGIVDLKARSPDKANAAFKILLKSRPGDPLALYFSGEALHARQKDTEAISAFRAVLKTWPDHAPALTAAARLMASPKASKDDLKEALTMSERATAIDPTNQAHWQLLADLCNQAGQSDRASAITLQYLSGPPKLR